MKTMKKALLVLLSLALVLSMAGAVTAESYTATGTHDATVGMANINSEFSITIPAEFSIDSSGDFKAAGAAVEVTKLLLTTGETFSVTVTSDDWNIQVVGLDASKQPYQMYMSTNGESGPYSEVTPVDKTATLFSLVPGNTAETVHLKFKVTTAFTSTYSGTYTDALTFNFGIQKSQAS